MEDSRDQQVNFGRSPAPFAWQQQIGIEACQLPHSEIDPQIRYNESHILNGHLHVCDGVLLLIRERTFSLVEYNIDFFCRQ